MNTLIRYLYWCRPFRNKICFYVLLHTPASIKIKVVLQWLKGNSFENFLCLLKFICLWAGVPWLLWAYSCTAYLVLINVIESSLSILPVVCYSVYVVCVLLKQDLNPFVAGCLISGDGVLDVECESMKRLQSVKGESIDWLKNLSTFCQKKQPYATNVEIYVVGLVDLQAYALATVNVSWFL